MVSYTAAVSAFVLGGRGGGAVRAVVVPVLVLVVGGLVSGCGGSASASGTSPASVRASGLHTPGASILRSDPSGDGARAPDGAVVKRALSSFAACVRVHGADPSRLADAAGRLAVRACRPVLTGALSSADASNPATAVKPVAAPAVRNHLTPALTVALQRFAACMRADGVNVPAPSSTSGAIFNAKGLDTTGGRFKAAEARCNHILQLAVNGGTAR